MMKFFSSGQVWFMDGWFWWDLVLITTFNNYNSVFSGCQLYSNTFFSLLVCHSPLTFNHRSSHWWNLCRLGNKMWPTNQLSCLRHWQDENLSCKFSSCLHFHCTALWCWSMVPRQRLEHLWHTKNRIRMWHRQKRIWIWNFFYSGQLKWKQ